EIRGPEDGVDHREAEPIRALRPDERLGHHDDLARSLTLEREEHAEQLVALVSPAVGRARLREHARGALHEEQRREAGPHRLAEALGRGPAEAGGGARPRGRRWARP